MSRTHITKRRNTVFFIVRHLIAGWSAFLSAYGGAGIGAEPLPLIIPVGTEVDQVRDLGKKAIVEIMQRFGEARGGENMESFIVLPLRKDLDQQYFTLQFENAFTQEAKQAGYKLYTRNDKALGELLDQIQWSQNNSDILDPSTIQELGKVVDAQAIVMPRVDITERKDGMLSVRVNMQVYERETFRLHWGDESVIVAKPPLSRDDLLFWTVAGIGCLAFLFMVKSFLGFLGRKLRPR